MANELILTTTGRRTGLPRSTHVLYGRRGDDIVVVASNGGRATDPQWYRNLLADPDVGVHVGDNQLRARARTATGTERDDLWQMMVAASPPYADYQRSLEREIPVVVLEPVE